MRVTIDLPDDTVIVLDRLRRATGRSRTSLVREAVERFLEKVADGDRAAAFGAWRDIDVEGLDRLRTEWGRTEP